MYSSEIETPAGRPSIIVSRPLPCDSPAVRNRNCISATPHGAFIPGQRLHGLNRTRSIGVEPPVGEIDELGCGRLLPVEVLDVLPLDTRAEDAERLGATGG